MATLTPASAAAIARLRSYVPPPTTWYSLPLSRRAAVLILLFADKRGDLRVVLTMRAATLKSYAGQAALPGGKSDSLHESPLETARREASEEIGLPMPTFPSTHTFAEPPRRDISISVPVDHPHSTKYNPPTPTLPPPFKIEQLCQLPTNLAKTELGVRPCVAFLSSTSTDGNSDISADVETTLIPRLDAKEVAAVFSGPLHGFLKKIDEYADDRSVKGAWYKGSWTDWHETKFRMHNFYVPVSNRPVTRPQKLDAPEKAVVELQTDSKPPASSSKTSPSSFQPEQRRTNYPRASKTLPYRDVPQPYNENNPDPLDALVRFRVFGMTARILVDCARVAYAEEPEFEHNSHFGDEAIIRRLIEVGKLDTERHRGDEFEGADLVKALQSQSFGGLVRSESEAAKL